MSGIVNIKLNHITRSWRLLLLVCLPCEALAAATVTSTFEEPALAAKLNSFSVYEGETGASSTFRSGNITFRNDGVFFGGTSWSGVGLSRKTTRTSTNFFDEGDDLIAKPLSGAGSPTWGVVFSEGIMTADSGQRFNSVEVANTLWAYESMRNGGTFVGAPFGNGAGTGRFAGQDDYFVVRFTNTSNMQTFEYSLADYRGATDFIREDWSTVDLSSLNANELSITLWGTRESTFDGGATYFQDLPSYVAIDNVTVTVPEPHTTVAVSLFVGSWIIRRRGWRRRSQRARRDRAK